MRDAISQLVSDAIAAAIDAGELPLAETPDPGVERPRDASHGDWATTVALRCARQAGMNPRQVAEIVAARLDASGDVDAVEIAGPGFINIRLAPVALMRVLREARELGLGFGRSDAGAGRRVQVEFVSANPVGPMHVGHGRWAALGDSMARVLAHAGWSVEREFYINDAGVQMDIFGKSVAARYLELTGHEVTFEDNWYQGAYIREIAEEILVSEGPEWADKPAAEREAHFTETAYAAVLEHLKHVLHGMGVDFDVWFSERTLHVPGPTGTTAVEDAIAALREAGHIYDLDGAVWFRSTAFGDDKDRVLIKADGEYTYFAADIAYHKNKYDRGFDRVINIWGADHHGYVARMEAAVAALGHPGQLDVVIGQLVNLFRGGEAVRMSKRTGEMVTFEDLLDEVGADAARYFFLRRSPTSRSTSTSSLRVSSPPTTPSTTCSTPTLESARSCAGPLERTWRPNTPPSLRSPRSSCRATSTCRCSRTLASSRLRGSCGSSPRSSRVPRVIWRRTASRATPRTSRRRFTSFTRSATCSPTTPRSRLPGSTRSMRRVVRWRRCSHWWG